MIQQVSQRTGLSPVVIQLGIGLAIAVFGFFFANTIQTLQARDASTEGRLAIIETHQTNLDTQLTSLRIQLDTINQRGSSGADQRLNALESRISVLETRLNSDEQIIRGRTNGV